MNKLKEPERYDKAIKLWGEELQFGMLSEECGGCGVENEKNKTDFGGIRIKQEMSKLQYFSYRVSLGKIFKV